MCRHQCICGVGQGIASGHGEERWQLDEPQILERFVDRSNLLFQTAIARSQAGQVLGHSCHPTTAAQMDTSDIRLSHVSHPVGVAAKHPGSKITTLTRARFTEHVKRRPQEQIHPCRLQLLANNLPHYLCITCLPTRAHRHVTWQIRKAGT